MFTYLTNRSSKDPQGRAIVQTESYTVVVSIQDVKIHRPAAYQMPVKWAPRFILNCFKFFSAVHGLLYYIQG